MSDHISTLTSLAPSLRSNYFYNVVPKNEKFIVASHFLSGEWLHHVASFAQINNIECQYALMNYEYQLSNPL
jgi:hypothetical protein